jgi:hypothetical protein
LGAVWIVAAADIRRRWASLLVLALIVGVVSALVFAAVAGARRTGSSLDAFEMQSRSADVELNVLGPPTRVQLRQLSRLPGVEAVAGLRAYGIVVEGDPDLQEIGTPTDSMFGTVVDRDRIIAGRPANPSAVNEVTIGEALATKLHQWVGGHLDIVSYAPAQVASLENGATDVGPYMGPRVRLRVVGIDRRPLDLGDRAESGGLLVLTPAFDRAYAGRIGIFGARLRVRTRDGAEQVPGVVTSAGHIFGGSLLSTQGLAVEKEGARNAINVLTVALWISAGLTAIVGGVIIGIGLAREVSLMSVQQETLRALGLTRRQRIMMGGPLALLVAGLGAILATGVAVLLSPLFPFGVARRADPDVGLHADPAVLALGTATLILVVFLIQVAVAYRLTESQPTKRALSIRSKASKVAEHTAHLGLWPTAVNGIRMAFEARRGNTAIPVRSAFLGAVLGVIGITSVLVFAANLNHLAATPQLYGWTWDFNATDTTSANTPCGGTDYGLSRQPGLAAVAEVCYQNIEIDSRTVAALAFTSLRGPVIFPEVVAGRSPGSPDEVALGSATLRALGKAIGDTVQARGLGASHAYTIVGQTVFPTFGQAQPLDDGALFTGGGFSPLFNNQIFSRYFVGRFAPDSSHAIAERGIAAIPQLTDLSGPTRPVEVVRLLQIAWFPLSVASLLGSMALLSVGSTLWTQVRRNRRQLAILKTLGFDRRQVRSTVAWQATVFATISLVVGIPSGLVVGRIAWRVVADGLGIETVATVPTAAVALIVIGTLGMFNLVAWFPARSAARTPPAQALHVE